MTDAAPVRVSGLARLEMRERGDAYVATITGEVDISNAEDLSRAIVQLPNQLTGLIVDLSGAVYLDSAALAVIHGLSERLQQRSQRLVVVCPVDAPCRRVLELAGLGARAPLVDDLTAAGVELRA